jgi:hypothetical protein
MHRLRNAPCTRRRQRRRGGGPVRTLTAEHRELAYLPGRLQRGVDGTEAARLSGWIATLFAGHVARENDLLLPALTGCGTNLAAAVLLEFAGTGLRCRSGSARSAACPAPRPRTSWWTPQASPPLTWPPPPAN